MIKKQERRSKVQKVDESEGITYESGIGISDPELLVLQKIVEMPSDATKLGEGKASPLRVIT